MARKLHVQFAEAQAQAAVAESREAAIGEALKEAEDRHTQQLKDAYLYHQSQEKDACFGTTGAHNFGRYPNHVPRKKDERCRTISSPTHKGLL